MDGLGVLDLRCYKKMTSISSTVVSSGSPLDLRTTRSDTTSSSIFSSQQYHEEDCFYSEPTPPRTPSQPSAMYTQQTRWNHRSHPSLDSDSSFESEAEVDASRSRALFYPSQCNTVADCVDLRRHSVDSPGRRESVSSNDHQDSACTDTDERESCGSDPAVSHRSYKELSDVIKTTGKKALVFQFACEAEILDAADVHSELIHSSTSKKSKMMNEQNGEDDDDEDEDALQVDETATCFEELLQIELESQDPLHIPENTIGMSNSIGAGIQEVASKYIKEIEMTKKDLNIGAQNFQVGTTGKRLLCPKCNEDFYNVSALWQHLMTHPSLNPGEKLIKCPVCTKRFATVNTLERHMLNLHTGEMKFICENCDTPFKYRTHLRKHMLNTRCGKGPIRKKKDLPESAEKFSKKGSKKRSRVESGCFDAS